MPLSPNQQLFEYRIERVLDQSTFDTVYLAYDILLERHVAIKALTITARTHQVAFEKFLQGARIASNLDSSHIVTVYSLKTQEPDFYLVTEYLAGGSLRGLLEKQRRLTIEQAVRITADVCEGLATAHSRGVVHRDIKPENILLTEEQRAKLSGFGIAHVPGSTSETYQGQLTGSGFQPGTLLYMSPEQILGQEVDGRSDVYQVGVLLYEMLTGQYYVDMRALESRARETAGSNIFKFQARLYELLAQAACEQEPANVCQLRSDVPKWVENLLVATMAKNVEARPSASDLATAIREYTISSLRSNRSSAALVARHLELGVDYGGQGQLNEAIGEFQAVLRIDPNCAEAHYYLGVAYQELERWEDAVNEYHAALHIDPNYTNAHSNLACVYSKQGKWQEAVIEEYQADLCTEPDNTEIHYNLGIAYAVQDRMEEAINEFKDVLRIDPRHIEAHRNLAGIYEGQCKWDKAVQEYQAVLSFDSDCDVVRQALERVQIEQARCSTVSELESMLLINPHDAEVHYRLAVAYQEQERWDEAAQEYEAALQINSEYALAHRNLAQVYQEKSQWDEAIDRYQIALRINPDDATIYRNLGWIYMKQGQWGEAARAYEEVLRFEFHVADVHQWLGWAYTRQSRWDKAIQAYQDALSIDPSDAWAHYGLGIVYLEQNRRDEAVQELKMAKHLGCNAANEIVTDDVGLSIGNYHLI
jgi:serine/threonine protein kinase/predicted TPR repeat methyltransferase